MDSAFLCHLLRCQLISVFIIYRLGLKGTEMNLEYIQRRTLSYTSGLHPPAVFKLILIQVSYDIGICRAKLHAEAVRITVLHAAAIPVIYLILVHHSRAGASHCHLIEAAAIAPCHLCFAPAVEISHKAYSCCVGCIGYKSNTLYLCILCLYCPCLFICPGLAGFFFSYKMCS